MKTQNFVNITSCERENRALNIKCTCKLKILTYKNCPERVEKNIDNFENYPACNGKETDS